MKTGTKVVVAGLHHRRSLLYEDSIKLLLGGNYSLVIQNTSGTVTRFGRLGVAHPRLRFHDSDAQIPYDAGMVKFKDILGPYEWDAVVFIDNDLFFTDLSYLKELIRDFIEGGYGYCSNFVNPAHYGSYVFKNSIAEVGDQRFEPTPDYPFLMPVPHWENALMLVSRDVWEELSREDISHGRLFLNGLVKAGAKMGVHKADHRHGYTHYGDGWFHVGNLMAYYYRVETGNAKGLDPDSVVDKSRLGYFVYQRERYGSSIYTDTINVNLVLLCGFVGGERAALKAWQELIKGTCLWTK